MVNFAQQLLDSRRGKLKYICKESEEFYKEIVRMGYLKI